MKITKVPKKYDMLEYEKEKALKGCDICPFCGESRPFTLIGNRVVGVAGGVCYMTTVRTGLFKWESMQVNCFTCETCGAKWESEPFRIC